MLLDRSAPLQEGGRWGRFPLGHAPGTLGFKNTRKPDPKVELISSTQPSLMPDGKRPADGNSYASRGPFACYFVGSIKCSYGVPGSMTYG